MADAQRKRRADNPEKYREINRVSERKRKFRKYGLTEETYISLLAKQNNVCAICKEINKSLHDWHIDHNHKTGSTRGILCHHCNLLLGNAKDEFKILYSAISYLKEYENV